MKKLFTLLTLLFIIPSITGATTYTAQQSGFYKNPATWGGTVPPYTAQAGDSLIIPHGIIVKLDTSIYYKGWDKTLIVNGTLTDTFQLQGPNQFFHELNIDSMNLLGNGAIDVFKLIATNQTIKDFSGKIAAYKLDCNGINHNNSSCHILIREDLNMITGLYTFHKGTLTIDTNSNINMTGGAFSMPPTNTAIFDFDRTHTLKYTNIGGATAGPEIQHGIQHKNIDLSWASELIITQDLHIHQRLSVYRSTIELNGHDLIIEPSGDYKSSAYGFLDSDPNNLSSIMVYAKNDISGGIRFATGKNRVSKFVVDMGSPNAKINFDGDIKIEDTLFLKKGRIDIDIYKIEVVAADTNKQAFIVGGSDSSYIITKDLNVSPKFTHLGQLYMQLEHNETKTYHIGSATRYLPIMLTNKKVRKSWHGVTAINLVRDKGDIGYNMSKNQPMVGASWALKNPTNSNLPSNDLEVTLMWKTKDEVNNFDRNNVYSSMTTRQENNWDTSTTVKASTAPNGYHSIKALIRGWNILYGTTVYMTVFDNKTNTSINDISSNTTVTLYPNPTNGNTTLDLQLEKSQSISATVTDVIGRVMYNKPATAYTAGNNRITLPTSHLPNATYFVTLKNKAGTILWSGELLKL